MTSPELPSECDSILTSGRWSEEEFAFCQHVELRNCSARADVFELFVSDSSGDEETSLFRPIVCRVVVVDQVILADLVWINTKTSSESFPILLVRGKLRPLARKTYLKSGLFRAVDFLNTTL